MLNFVNKYKGYQEFYQYFERIENDNYAQIFFITKANESIQSLPDTAIPTPAIKDRICDNDWFINSGNAVIFDSKI